MNKAVSETGFTINVPMIDWFTATTYEASYWRFWTNIMFEQDRNRELSPSIVNERIMQYTGRMLTTRVGNLFVGEGLQAGTVHLMARCSGELATLVADGMLKSGVLAGLVKSTRLDLQITVRMPDDWSQYRQFSKLRSDGLTASYLTSKSKKTNLETATVYIGSRSSERMTRMYVKESREGERFLRWETEYKGSIARLLCNRLMSGETTIAKTLSAEISTNGTDDCWELFLPILGEDGDYAHGERVMTDSRRKTWLMTQVLPAFTSYINEHDADFTVIHSFYNAIKKSAGDISLVPEGTDETE